MTEYSCGTSSVFCRKASAITSLTTSRPAATAEPSASSAAPDPLSFLIASYARIVKVRSPDSLSATS